ncbi:MAG: metal-sulfur cluster assembly factor [Gemmatimonadaceae bacterium]
MSEHELPIAPDPVKAHPAGVAPDEATNAPADTTAATAAEGAPTETSATPGAVGEDQVRLALRRVKDPELNLNILDLGLIYEIRITGADVAVDMSLTSPGCPSGPEIMTEAEQQLKALPGVGTVAMNLVWSPPWTPDRIEPRVRAYLGF